MHSSGAALRRKCCKKLWQRLPTTRRWLAERVRLLGATRLALRAALTGVISASLPSRSADQARTELISLVAERVRLTRAILALALRARCARPKSLPAIWSNSGEFVHAPCSAQSKKDSRTGPILIVQMAERVRFELTSPVKGLRFSRPVHSTALPPLRRVAARFYPTKYGCARPLSH